MLNLGVNVDHVATLREARGVSYPFPGEAAIACEEAGAWGITAHLREDRRHINDEDMLELARTVKRLNMEMAATGEMVAIAEKLLPHSSCLVPEKREELTTEGGLDVLGNKKWIGECVSRLQSGGIIVSLFIDPDERQLDAAAELKAEYVELHTGAYANASGGAADVELGRLIAAAEHAHAIGLNVNAGHGIEYVNIKGILEIPHLKELNIGHSIVSKAVMVGMKEAVRQMIKLMKPYSK
ncbi:MAG: pyridoxine 5'-phosphate synthase [Kiritimatiellaeota bacterium]|nr:pyridoxine 5'-phosphate synthase [Kiritimatiellota bacterium]